MRLIFFSLFVFVSILIYTSSFAQVPELSIDNLSIHGNIEAYYAKDNDLQQTERTFASTAPFTDEFRLDIASLTARYEDKKVRGIFTLQYGDIPDYNWDERYKYIQEANIGFSPVENLWIDGGFFITHVGNESMFPKDNFLTSIAIVTYYEPLHQSGIKVSYDFSDELSASLYLLNGYNQLSDNNKNKSAGVSINYKPGKSEEIIYNGIIGNEQPYGEIPKLRYYGNLIFKKDFGKNNQINLSASVDFCMQEKSNLVNPSNDGFCGGGLLALRYNFNKYFSLSMRGDYFKDDNGILFGTYVTSSGKIMGLSSWSIASGVEYHPMENCYVRLEGGYMLLFNELRLFSDDDNYKITGIYTMGLAF